MGTREGMTLLAKHESEWDGVVYHQRGTCTRSTDAPSRAWRWVEDGVCHERILINETEVTGQ